MTPQDLERRMAVYRKCITQIEDYLEWSWSEDTLENRDHLSDIIEQMVDKLMAIK